MYTEPMKFNRTRARELTTPKEFELYDLARTVNLNKLAPRDLKNLVRRSRTSRDKHLDVKRTQIRSTQSVKRSRGADASERNRERAELFADIHDAFVARLAKLEAKPRAARPKSKKPLASAVKKPRSSVGSASAARSVKATTASKAASRPELGSATRSTVARKTEQARIDQSGIKRQRGHLAGLNRRQQGK